METIAFLVGSSLPMAVLVFVGSYVGIWKRNQIKLPFWDKIGLFFALWLISAGLWLLFRIILSGQDEVIRSTVGNLWGPLVVGIIVGRSLVSWRRKVREETLSAGKDT
ncbi:MAG: hypothetical protein AB7K73_12755 [Gammaproteobacteria bacterium]